MQLIVVLIVFITLILLKYLMGNNKIIRKSLGLVTLVALVLSGSINVYADYDRPFGRGWDLRGSVVVPNYNENASVSVTVSYSYSDHSVRIYESVSMPSGCTRGDPSTGAWLQDVYGNKCYGTLTHPGAYSVYVSATYDHGIRYESCVGNIYLDSLDYIDTVAPVVNISGKTFGSEATYCSFKVDATDNVGVVAVYLDGTQITNNNWYAVYTYGNHTISAVDAAGNWGAAYVYADGIDCTKPVLQSYIY